MPKTIYIAEIRSEKTIFREMSHAYEYSIKGKDFGEL